MESQYLVQANSQYSRSCGNQQRAWGRGRLHYMASQVNEGSLGDIWPTRRLQDPRSLATKAAPQLVRDGYPLASLDLVMVAVVPDGWARGLLMNITCPPSFHSLWFLPTHRTAPLSDTVISDSNDLTLRVPAVWVCQVSRPSLAVEATGREIVFC